MEKSGLSFSCTINATEEGGRLDVLLVHHLPDHSRSALYKLISNGSVQVNDEKVKPEYKVHEGDRVTVVFPDPEPCSLVPEKVDFGILHEDEDIFVIVKPPGIVVHPAAGHKSGTLVHGLLYHCDSLPGLNDDRPGIVHRLDKDTSGVMLVAKTDQALKKLTEDFRNRNVTKIYHALLLRSPPEEYGRITAAIGRHPVNRKKMAIVTERGRSAATNWEIIDKFGNGMCFVELGLETGRTHQIRVHMASIGCPVAGDELYGGKVPGHYGLGVKRQLLHSSTIQFKHPRSGKQLSFSAPLFADMVDVLVLLRDTAEPVG